MATIDVAKLWSLRLRVKQNKKFFYVVHCQRPARHVIMPRRRYTYAFKIDAINLALVSGRKEAAAELNIAENLLFQWMAREDEIRERVSQDQDLLQKKSSATGRPILRKEVEKQLDIFVRAHREEQFRLGINELPSYQMIRDMAYKIKEDIAPTSDWEFNWSWYLSYTNMWAVRVPVNQL